VPALPRRHRAGRRGGHDREVQLLWQAPLPGARPGRCPQRPDLCRVPGAVSGDPHRAAGL